MIHALLFVAALLFILFMFGLGGAWAAHTTWILFTMACALTAIWALASIAIRPLERRGPGRPLHS